MDRAVQALLVAAEQARDRARYEDHPPTWSGRLEPGPPKSGDASSPCWRSATTRMDAVRPPRRGAGRLEAELDDTAGALDGAYLH